MAEHNELGKAGEKLAQEMLLKKGYEILETNWYFQKAEVDIIAQKEKDTIVIVEVKTRNNEAIGKPEEFISKKKISLLVKAADAYVQKQDLDVEVRFDVVAVIINEKYQNVRHIEDAFYYFQ